MPVHDEERLLPYKPRQLYDLVADVARYPEFLPWCQAARVRQKDERLMIADLVIGFKMVRERYTSRVVLDPEQLTINASHAEGPFKKLENHWRFEAVEQGCLLKFHVDFEFRSRLLQRLIEVFFEQATHKMVAAFEARAKELYGSVAA